MRILFLADVFGSPGRRAVEERLPGLREELGVGFCVVNGENAADGRGLTPKLADKLLAAGADVVTLGNHVWARDEIAPYLEQSERVIRPANVASGSPGRALAVAPAADGTPVAVVNLMGWLFLDVPRGPFELVDSLVEEARKQAKVVIVDFHAEATSEKVAVSRWLDGKVTAVIGTHTHVQTSDARIQPGGTAAITDAGMTGPHDSVIGVEADLAIRRMRTGMPTRFRPAEGGVRLEGVVVDCDADGRATAIEALRVDVSLDEQHREQRDQQEVAEQHHERRERPEVEDEVPVAEREPELRGHERGGQEPARRQAAAAARRAARAARARSGTAARAPCRRR